MFFCVEIITTLKSRQTIDTYINALFEDNCTRRTWTTTPHPPPLQVREHKRKPTLVPQTVQTLKQDTAQTTYCCPKAWWSVNHTHRAKHGSMKNAFYTWMWIKVPAQLYLLKLVWEVDRSSHYNDRCTPRIERIWLETPSETILNVGWKHLHRKSLLGNINCQSNSRNMILVCSQKQKNNNTQTNKNSISIKVMNYKHDYKQDILLMWKPAFFAGVKILTINHWEKFNSMHSTKDNTWDY